MKLPALLALPCLVALAEARPRWCGVESRPSALRKEAAAPAAWTGTLDVAVLRVSLADAPYQEDSAALEAANREVERFFRDNSGGAFAVRLRIVPGVFHSSRTRAWYAANDEDFEIFASFAEDRLRGAGWAEGRDWDRYLVSFPLIEEVGWIGLSGGLGTPDNWVNGEYDAAVIVHELGHAIGLPHAASVDAQDSVLPASPETGEYQEYGDGFDVMGDGTIAGHFSTIFKRDLGWLAPAEIRANPGPGIHRIHAHDGGERPGQVLALRLRSGNGRFDYWVEYRGAALPFENNARTSANVRVENYLDERPLLLDMTPGSQDPWWDFADGGLEVGETYRDRYGGFTLRTVAVSSPGSPAWVDVEVAGTAVSLARPPAKRPAAAPWQGFRWAGERWDAAGRITSSQRKKLRSLGIRD